MAPLDLIGEVYLVFPFGVRFIKKRRRRRRKTEVGTSRAFNM